MNGSLICKFISLCCCCLASYSYAQPILVFYPDWIRILIPSFVSGYIIVDLSEIISITMGEQNLFIETAFAGIGCIASFVCGIFEIYQWTSWFVSVIEDVKTTGWQELTLAISCLLNATILLIDFVHYVRQRSRSNEIEDSINTLEN